MCACDANYNRDISTFPTRNKVDSDDEEMKRCNIYLSTVFLLLLSRLPPIDTMTDFSPSSSTLPLIQIRTLAIHFIFLTETSNNFTLIRFIFWANLKVGKIVFTPKVFCNPDPRPTNRHRCSLMIRSANRITLTEEQARWLLSGGVASLTADRKVLKHKRSSKRTIFESPPLLFCSPY